MATRTWKGGPPGTYSFNSGSNWNGGTVPASGDMALFENPGSVGPYTVTGTATVGQIWVDQDTIDLTGSFSGPSLALIGFTPLNVTDGGSLDVAGSFTSAGTGSVGTFGRVASTGTLEVDGTLGLSVLDIQPGGMVKLAGTGTLSGTIDLLGGTLDAISGPLLIPNSLAVSGASTSVLRADTPTYVTGMISGAGGLAFAGTLGIVLDDTATGFTGGTTLQAGPYLYIDSSGALGTGPFNLNGGYVATITGATIGNFLSFSGTSEIGSPNAGTTLEVGGGGWDIASNSSINIGEPGFAGTVAWDAPSGGIALTQPYNVSILGGTLRSGNASVGALVATDTTTTVNLGATLDMAGYPAGIAGLQGGGTITNSGSAAELDIGGGNFSGVISGPISLVPFGTVTLSGTSTFSGGTTVQSGDVLYMDSSGALGTGALNVNGGTVASDVGASIGNYLSVAGTAEIGASSGKTLDVGSGGWNASGSNIITFGNSLLDGTVVWHSPTGSVTFPPSVNVAAGTLRAGDGSLSTLLGNDATTTVNSGADSQRRRKLRNCPQRAGRWSHHEQQCFQWRSGDLRRQFLWRDQRAVGATRVGRCRLYPAHRRTLASRSSSPTLRWISRPPAACRTQARSPSVPPMRC